MRFVIRIIAFITFAAYADQRVPHWHKSRARTQVLGAMLAGILIFGLSICGLGIWFFWG